MNRQLSSILIILAAIIGISFIHEPTFSEKIRYAGSLIGIDYTDTEIELMEDEVKQMVKTIEENRTTSLDNGISPVLSFDPRPEGFKIPQGNSNLQISIPEHIMLPKDSIELAYLSIPELASLIRSGQITSVGLTEFYLSRLKKHDPQLHCVITYMEDRALAQANKMDKELAEGKDRGLLHGIPCGIKDLLSTKDYKTTWGAKPFKDQFIPYDATVVEKLETSGAVIIAKLTMGSLAWGDVWYGEKTRNPWDLNSGSSGSSAGSASAVSAGLLPFAIGTETLGSIVSPSTVCGTTGLRPTYGRVSRYGAMALCWSMDKIGPITRNAQDAAIVLHAINGPDQKDPHAIPAPFTYSDLTDVTSYKIGYVKSHFDRDYAMKANDSIALSRWRALGLQIEAVELPDFPSIGLILDVEAATAFDELTTSGLDDSLVRQIANAWPNVFRQARLVPAVEYLKANRLRRILIEDMHKLLSEYDVIIHPSWNSSALSISNYTGHPAIVIPNGFREGKPTSISMMGKLYGEEALIHVAKLFQENTDYHLQHPTI